MHNGPDLINELEVGRIRPAQFAQVSKDPHVRQVFTSTALYMELRQDDIEAVLTVMASAVAFKDLTYQPLWLMIVGPSSSGKTEALDLLGGLEAERMNDITMPGLLGVRASKSGPATMTGLLSHHFGDEPENHGLITVPDFSTMLGAQGGLSEKAAAVFSALRTIYDGNFERIHHDTGMGVLLPDGTVSNKAEWHGRLTFLGACTNAIDNYGDFGGDLGPRFLYYRFTPRSLTERTATGLKAAMRFDTRKHREDSSSLVARAVRDARERARAWKDLNDEATMLCVSAADLLTLGRATVPRDKYGRREICGVPDVEEPMRAVGQLVMLLKGLRALQVHKDVCFRIVRRCALSSMPIPRANVLQVLARGSYPSTNQIALACGMNHHVTAHALEEWEALGVMECTSKTPVLDVNTPLSNVTDPHSWRIKNEYMPLVRQIVV